MAEHKCPENRTGVLQLLRESLETSLLTRKPGDSLPCAPTVYCWVSFDVERMLNSATNLMSKQGAEGIVNEGSDQKGSNNS
jgi:hypothetical protein